MQMHGVRDPNHQLLAVGYEPIDGVLRVQWRKGEGEHRGVPEDLYLKLRRVPFAYRQYQATIKGKFPYTKIESPVQKPEKVSDGKTSNVQNAAGRVRNGSDVGGLFAERTNSRGLHHERQDVFRGTSGHDGGSTGVLQDSRCDAQSAGGRVMECFYPPDVTFQEEGHAYFLKGQRIPFSLTQILELSGISRQPSSATEIAARPAAAKRGTKIHEATLLMDQDDFDLESLKPWPEYYNRCVGWQQFREDFHFQPDLTMCEVPIAVKVNGCLYGMKLDAYGTTGDGEKVALAVVEKKCTAQEEDSHAIQTAGQALAFKSHGESLQMPLKRYVVYLFDKLNAANRYYRVVEHEDRNDEKIFCGAGLANVYWRLNHGLLKG